MTDLSSRLEDLARTPILLVASDYDGTLSPIVSDPDLAIGDREALVALRILSELPQTYVAVISGRALEDLAQRTVAAGNIHLVGSHGSEFEPGFVLPISNDLRHLLGDLTADVQQITDAFPGAIVERKPASLAFHYRNVDERRQSDAVERLLDGPGRRDGVHVRHGKKVIEFSVVDINKGAALRRVVQRVGASAVVFIGDDVTDEDAFATLSESDLAIKVGAGPSRAPHRLAQTVDVARLLAKLAERRAQWLAGSEAVPIEQHSLLSDQRTAALVGPTGRIVWLCLPRIDSAAVFAELLGGPAAGYFEVRSAEHSHPLAQAYVGDSFVLQTTWPGFTVTDYLDASSGRAYQRAGRSDLIRSIEGRGRVVITFAPRLDFGRIATRLLPCAGGITVEGALDPLVLAAPGIRWEIVEEGPHQTARGAIELTERPVVMDLRCGTANLEQSAGAEPIRRRQNQRFWQEWAAMLSLPSVAPEMVRRSALVLKALTYGPTGAIAAAATTSLPECLGGVRNWDYRYCWPRDAAMAARALVRLGATGPGLRLLDWIMGILEHSEPTSLMRPVYTVTGGHLASEGEISQLSGYRGSRPVRVGNAASNQIQLDVFGPIADLMAALGERGAAVTPDHWRLTERMVDAIARHWREPDHGIWELRVSRRHHVHSKVMCWLTLDRAIAIGKYLGRSRPEWAALGDEIANDLLHQGWSPACEAFGTSYEDAAPDAAALWVGLSGMLDVNDPRFRGTVAYVEQSLRRGATVFRYSHDDGLPGTEGGFNLCTAWLIEAFCALGHDADAQGLFQSYVRLAGPTGLMSEEYEPQTRTCLGNYPQAYTHVGLINAAVALSQLNS